MNKIRFKVVAALFVKYLNGKPHFLLGLRDEFHPAPLTYEFPGGKRKMMYANVGNELKDVEELVYENKPVIYENAKDAINREMNEELGVDITVKDKIWEASYEDYDVELYECELLSENFKLTAHKEICWGDVEFISNIQNTVLSLPAMLPLLKTYEK